MPFFATRYTFLQFPDLHRIHIVFKTDKSSKLENSRGDPPWIIDMQFFIEAFRHIANEISDFSTKKPKDLNTIIGDVSNFDWAMRKI